MAKDYFSSFNPVINFLFFIGAAAFTMCVSHPAFVAVSAFWGFMYILSVKGRCAFKTGAAVLALFAAVSVINPLFNTRGEIILFTWFSGRPYTFEALLAGMATGGMCAAMLLWFSGYNAVMSSDRLMYIFGRVAPSVTLVIIMVLRFVPMYVKRGREINLERSGIGKGVSKSAPLYGRIKNGALQLLSLSSWALENGITTADSMRCRGFGTAKRSSFLHYGFKKRDAALCGSLIVFAAVCAAFCAAGGAKAVFIPRIILAGPDSFGFIPALCSYFLFLTIPTVLNIREKLKWQFLKSGI